MMSGYFSATETAFSTFSQTRMKTLAADGNKRAALVLELAGDYDRILSTILIGNNIVNLSSASLATVIFTRWFGDAGVTISTAVMTVLVLIFGEISPKSLAKEAPDSFSMFSAPFLRFFTCVLAPLNWVFSQWKRLLSRVVRVSDQQAVSDQEILTMVEEAEQGGGIDRGEGELIRNAISFGDLTAGDVLTPRVDIACVDETDEREEAARIFAETGFSRLPVCRRGADSIIGVLHFKDFAGGGSIAELCKPAVFVSESMGLYPLLQLLQGKKSHLAVVVDEHGGTSGIVTLEDVLEELVGDIWDEHDASGQSDIEQLSETEYRVQGGASFEKLRRVLGLREDCDVSTVGGWTVARLGKIPAQGDAFRCGEYAVTVTGVGKRRVSQVHLVRVEAQAS